MNHLTRFPIATLLLALFCSGIFAQTGSSPGTAPGQPPGQQTTSSGQPTTPAGQPTTDNFVLNAVEPAAAMRGQRVTLSGAFPADVASVSVELQRIGGVPTPVTPPTPDTRRVAEPQAIPATIKEATKSLTFRVPLNLPLDKYDVLVTFARNGKKSEQVPLTIDESFRITAETLPKITALHPTVSYLKDEKPENTYDFRIIGEGFSQIPEDNHLIIDGIGSVALCPPGREPDGKCVKVEVMDAGRELQVAGVPLEPYGGTQRVRVRVGEQVSDPVPITLSRVGRRWPMVIAFGALALLLILIALVLHSRKKAEFIGAGGKKHTLLSAILLDPETNSYSLSKFQFYAWTIAVILGYVYLTAARSLVRWDFTFADLPDNLPGIIFIAASTSALAIGISSARGSKGAGDVFPSAADLITTGGVIAAERLQFFVWTVVGVVTFIFLTFSIEPGKIEELPAVPEKFLYLMGISSFGYLGGKLARKPGPKIDQIEAERGSLILAIHGSNLSPEATFKIDGTELALTMLDDAVHPDGKPEVKDKDEQTGFAKLLRLVIAEPEPEWETGGKHLFVLVNPNGEKAESIYELPEPPTITAITPKSGPSAGGTSVTITGTHFTDDTKVKFGETPATSVTLTNATSLTAQTPPHTAGAVDVVVEDENGSGKLAGGFTYN